MDLRPLELLTHISSEMLSVGPLHERAERLVAEIVRYFRVDSCIIRTLEPDGNLKLLAAVGVEGMTIAPLLPAFYGISRGILEDRTAVVIEDAATHPLTALLYAKGKNVPGRFVFESYAGAPMLGDDGPVGVIGIYSCRERRHFDEQTIQFLQIVANHFGVLIVNNRLKESLEQRVADRTAELAKARDEANAASRAKSDFLACMSHELQTPLNSIVGFGQLLENSFLDERQREAVSSILESSRLLVDIIKDILDFSNLETGRMALRVVPFSPRESLEPTFELMRNQAQAKGLNYQMHVDQRVPRSLLGDPMRISQAVMHLLSNAVKFTESGHVGLNVTYGIPNGSTCPALVIAVDDSGLGLPDGIRPGALRPFTQADQSISRANGGMGLGLTLVERLVKAMGGTLHIVTRPRAGTIATVTIPCVEVPGLSSLGLRTADQRLTPASVRILVVEDNAANRLVLRRMLERMGIVNISMAEGGEEALKVLEAESVDLILMDIHMPGMDGLDCTRRIKARDWDARRLPIIAVTAASTVEDTRRYLDSGMDAVIPKPVEASRLAEVLGAFVLPIS
ncbi:response regulator [bacterium]|nr:response regulator [bacterium]